MLMIEILVAGLLFVSGTHVVSAYLIASSFSLQGYDLRCLVRESSVKS